MTSTLTVTSIDTIIAMQIAELLIAKRDEVERIEAALDILNKDAVESAAMVAGWHRVDAVASPKKSAVPHSPNSDRVWKDESRSKLSASIRRVNRRKAKGLAPYSTKEEMRQYQLRQARNQRRTQRARFERAHDNRADVRSDSFLPEIVVPTLRKRGARK